MNYFGARYLDPMLGLWTSVDAARQFASPYLYAGNFANPINGFDSDGFPDAIEDMDPDSFGSGNVYLGEPILEDE